MDIHKRDNLNINEIRIKTNISVYALIYIFVYA